MQPNGPQNLWQPQNQPGGVPQPTPVPSQSQAAPAPPVAPVSVPQSPSVQPEVPAPLPPQPVVPEQQPQQNDNNPSDEEAEPQSLSWEASEFIDHEKDILWFLGFAIVVLVFLGAAIWVQAWTFVVLIIIMAVATIVYVRRPPRTMRYSLSEQGLHIGQQFHPYKEYRAFGVVQDGPLEAIMLVSTKRFMPATLIYIDEKDGEQIVDIFSEFLPIEDLDLDLADIFIRKLRL